MHMAFLHLNVLIKVSKQQNYIIPTYFSPLNFVLIFFKTL